MTEVQTVVQAVDAAQDLPVKDMDGGKASADKASKYLTFTLAGEDYGIGIRKIREIIGMMPITSVPQTPAHIKGVINLRGKVIPVVDLRLRFNMEAADYAERTCIVVVEIPGQSGTVLNGIVVDSVSEVLNIKDDDIEEAPQYGAKLHTDYLLGIAKTEGGVKILLDIDHIVRGQDMATLEEAE